MNAALCLVCLMLVPLASAGLALIHQGLGRSRSAAHAMLSTLCVLAVSAIVFVLVGSAWAGFAGGPAHTVTVAGVAWDWLGAAPSARTLRFDGPDAATLNRSLTVCLEIFAVGLAGVIPLSAGTDRWRLGPICLASAAFSALVFPMFAHWVWGGGWLAQLGTTFGLAPFFDAGGASVIQVTGGLMALSVAWIAGPRRGKYSDDGIAAAIPGHNIVLVLFGCLLAFAGWAGLDSAASILFYAAGPQQVAGVLIDAMLSASAGCLAAVVTTRARYRKPDASISANGWIAGLVAGSAACAIVSPVAAIDTGLVAGVLVTYLVEIFELRLLIDDPGGAVSVHAGAGVLGLLSAGVFGHFAQGSRGSHILAQGVGIAALLGFLLPLLHAINLALNRLLPYRVDGDGDWQGMDIRELGAGAYPEFVVHADEFVPR
jgi:Amt family ammonium transporter